MKIIYIVFFLLIVIPLGAYGRSTEEDCLYQDSCGRCLKTHINCAWCTDKTYEFTYRRCMTHDQLVQFGCNENSILENEPEQIILKDSPVKDYKNVNDAAVQMQPQKIYLKLVKSNTEQIKLRYRPARNNPLDLYVLMDLTWTMQDDKQTLVELGVELAEALRKLTGNYRLGFGSFADKPTMPMIMPYMNENPCAAENEVCEPTYGYRHHLELTDDITAFIKSVNGSRITANLDNLEGGFDALMQVLVCKSQIGWKDEARKIVILVTDGFMHFAGDGLLAGITRPNDKQCHLNENGEYTGSLIYDYPSLEEIYRELLQRKVNVIFAVTSGVVSTYKEMNNLIRDISNVEILSSDSSNILELIGKSYAHFIKRVQFIDDSPSFINVEYSTNCGGQLSKLQKRNYCNNVEMGTEVDFYINITLTDFPDDGIYKRIIRIEESSLTEVMEIEVEIQRECPCDEEVNPNDAYRRIHCSENGYLQCGMCVCDKDWTGAYCSCSTDTTNATTNEAIENRCRPKVTNSDELGNICSNHGECDCGQCLCWSGYNGKYCECQECDVTCDLELADCVCGQCICKYGWSNNKCNCKDTTKGCVGPTEEVCSDRGYCECGKCHCNGSFRGRFCEIGTSTENKLCSFFEPCVICLIEEKLGTNVCNNMSQICSSSTELNQYTFGFVTKPIDSDERCLVRTKTKDGDVCDHYFTYQSLGYDMDNYLMIWVNDCVSVKYAALIGGAMLLLATFVIGLIVILIIWCAIRLKDASEYARFEESQKASILNESPYYKDPMRNYVVPHQVNTVQKNPFL